MSDTTTTITPEERALWFKDAQPKSVSHYEPIDFELDKRIRRLLTALEAADAETVRLLAERDWLAENVEGRPCDYDSCPFGLPRPTGPDYGCGKTHVQCWQKALTPRRG